MRTNLEFRSVELLDPVIDEDTPRGERVATLLAEQLPAYGYQIERVHVEDWGWRVQLANAAFPLWLGCGHYEEYEDGHLCFIEPSQPYVRRWFKRVKTVSTVENLADAIEKIMSATGVATGLRWWSPQDVEQGGPCS